MNAMFWKSKLIWLMGFLMLTFLVLPEGAFCEGDTTSPTGSIIIADNEAYTASRTVSLSLSATDTVGVTGYYISENTSAMSGETLPSFTSVASTQTFSTTTGFTLSEEDGLKTVYVWFIDAAENISNAISDSIILDTTAPEGVSIKIGDASGSTSTSQITVTLSATDTNLVAGYRVSESSSEPGAAEDFTLLEEPASSLNTSFPFTLSKTIGTKTLYAWFIDEVGNISSTTATVDFSYGWLRVYDFGNDVLASEFANEMAQDSSGNIYMVGSTGDDIEGDTNETLYGSAFVYKLNSAGDIIWSRLLEVTDSRTEGTVYSSAGREIAVDGDGNVYIGGDYDYDIYIDTLDGAFVAKLDSSGNQLWLKTYDHSSYDEGVRLIDIGVVGVGEFCNLYVLAYTSDPLALDTVTVSPGYGYGPFLAKYNSSGTLEWAVASDNNMPSQGAMTVDADGNAYMTGPDSAYNALLLSKFKSDGTNDWSTLSGQEGYDEYGNDIVRDSSGNIYVAGSVWPDAASVTEGKAFIAKFNSGGSALWSDVLSLPASTYDYMSGEGVAVDSDGNVYLGCTAIREEDTGEEHQVSRPDLFLYKYSSAGTELWTKRIGEDGTEGDSFTDILITPEDKVITLGDIYNYYPPGLAGQLDPTYNSADAFLWKSSSDDFLDLELPVAGSLTINGGAESVIGNRVTINLSATDNTGVIGYRVSESNTIPAPHDFTLVEETTEFSADVPCTFESAETGSRTVYVWYRDSFGNFSPVVTASINVTGDEEAPVPGNLLINGGAEDTDSTTLTIELSATDNVAVTGYYLTEGYEMPSPEDFTPVNPAQSFSGTVYYTLQDISPGTVYVSAYFIDAAGNINTYDDRAKSTITLEDTTPPTTTVDPPSGYYDGPITVTLTATDDSDMHIGETLYSSVKTYYSVNGGDGQIYSDPFVINPPATIRFLSADSYGYDFLGANFEAVQTVTYGLSQAASGTLISGDKTSVTFDAEPGSTLNLSFSLDEVTAAASIRDLSESGTVILTLRKPDGTTYGTYSYIGSKIEILIEDAAGGTWTLEIDNSAGTATIDYEANVNGTPGISLRDVIAYLRIMAGFDNAGISSLKDIDGDGRIGLPEVIHMIQKLVGR